MKPSLRIIFAGTPDFAATHLSALLNSHHQVVAVYTQPDKPAGRGNKLTASAVKKIAQDHNIALYQPKSLRKAEAQAELASIDADVMVVVAYGLILPKAVLGTPRLGCINVHGSLLPKWRGAAPIQRAIWAGDDETGVTIMQMDEGLDTGNMLSIARVKIEPTQTSADLYHKLAELGPPTLISCLDDIAQAKITPQKQDDSLATYAHKLTKEEAGIDWSMSAVAIERCIRAFNPWPVCYFALTIPTGETIDIKVWQAHVDNAAPNAAPGTILFADKRAIGVATGDGILCLTSLQIPGKKAMDVASLLNARQNWFTPGTLLLRKQSL